MKTKATKKVRKAVKRKKRIFKPKQELHGTALLRPYPSEDNISLEGFYGELAETVNEVEPIFTTYRRRATFQD